MKLTDLTRSELSDHLKQGLHLQMGPFVVQIQTRIRSAIDGIAKSYSDYSIVENHFADFHVRLTQPSGVRRWIRPQVLFECDGNLPFKPLPYDQAFPMLEWGLNWCVSSHAQSYLIIHAAVIERHGYAAILPAPPGSGKSTLCAALIHRGWRLLSDELTLIRLSDGLITALPRPVSLKNQSIDVIKSYVPDAVFNSPVRDTIKGTVAHLKPSEESVLRYRETAKVAWVIFPQYRPDAILTTEHIPKARSFMRVADNAFNYSLLGSAGFHTLAGVIDGAESCELTYSALDDAIDFFNGLSEAKQ